MVQFGEPFESMGGEKKKIFFLVSGKKKRFFKGFGSFLRKLKVFC